VLFFAFMLAPHLVRGHPSQSLESYLSRARQFEAREDYSGAEGVYQQALAVFPGNAEILKRLGIVYQTENKFDTSIELFQKILQQAPSYPDVNLYLGLSYFGLNRFEDAAGALNKGLADNPADPRAHRYLAFSYEWLGRNLEAIEHLESLLHYNPKDAEALFHLARLYKNSSIEAIRRLSDLDPDSYLLHALQGEVDIENERYPDAITEYKVVLQKRPNFPGVHYSMGYSLRKMGRMAEGEQELRQALREDPTHPMANFYLGEILVANQKFQEAIPLLNVTFKALPKFASVHVELGKCYFSEEDLDTAQQEFAKAAELDPADPTPHYLLARLYGQLKQKDKSESELALFQKLSQGEKANTVRKAEIQRVREEETGQKP
jgi:tetratricopeptide (TPR) repeat protein